MITRRQFNSRLAASVAALPLASVAATRTPAGSTVVDVLVIGAGLSGLESALQLEDLGARVLVIEARQRVGGRVFTLFDRPGYPEVGGNGFGAGYGRVLSRVKALGLPLLDSASRRVKGARMELVLDSQVIPREAWSRSPWNPLPETARNRMPWEFAGGFVASQNPLQGADEWLAESSAPLDVSLHDWLAGRGLDDRTIKLCWTTNPYFGSSAYDVSALQCLYNDAWTKAVVKVSSAAYSILGGNQKLPIAMAAKLKNEVHLGKEVTAIREESDAAEVFCRDGSRYRAKAVICSVPFSVLRHVRFEPGLTGPQAEAVNALPYMTNTLVFFVPKRRYWEADGLSPTMWTDGPAGTIAGQRFGKDDDEITAIVANPRGIAAAWLDRLPPAEAVQLVQAEIERLRPAARGALEGGRIHSWARERYSGGDWAVFAPGQVERFARTMSAARGRVHFCGEHTAKANRGMEGAMESAERVTLEVAEKI